MQSLLVVMAVIVGGAAMGAESEVATTEVFGESCVLPATRPVQLLYGDIVPESVRVRSLYDAGADAVVTYEEGRDYVIDCAAGTLSRVDGSRIPDYTTHPAYGLEKFNHTDFPKFDNLGFFVFVDYTARGKHSLVELDDQTALLPKTRAKLTAGEPLHVIVYGDSITFGCDIADPQFTYPHRFVAALQKRYPDARITLENGATDGDSTRGGIAKLEERVLSKSPDLVLIAFGMNDHNIGSTPLDEFRQNLKSMIDSIRERAGAETILLSAFPPNPRWVHSANNMSAYAEATRMTAADCGSAYADVWSAWGKVLARKDLQSMLANNVNHPTEFGHWLYALALDALGI